jgi:hypothetical protein
MLGSSAARSLSCCRSTTHAPALLNKGITLRTRRQATGGLARRHNLPVERGAGCRRQPAGGTDYEAAIYERRGNKDAAIADNRDALDQDAQSDYLESAQVEARGRLATSSQQMRPTVARAIARCAQRDRPQLRPRYPIIWRAYLMIRSVSRGERSRRRIFATRRAAPDMTSNRPTNTSHVWPAEPP